MKKHRHRYDQCACVVGQTEPCVCCELNYCKCGKRKPEKKAKEGGK